jgi:hypothetical protein
MTTVMTTALADAGIKVQLIKRIWLWLHDHPGRTMAEVAAALKEEKMAVSSRLNELENRCMITSVKEYMRDTGRQVKRFTVVGKEYEILPMKRAVSTRQPAKKFANTPTVPIAQVAAIAPPSKVLPTKDWMDKYTLGELRTMYADLKTLFGG